MEPNGRASRTLERISKNYKTKERYLKVSNYQALFWLSQ